MASSPSLSDPTSDDPRACDVSGGLILAALTDDANLPYLLEFSSKHGFAEVVLFYIETVSLLDYANESSKPGDGSSSGRGANKDTNASTSVSSNIYASDGDALLSKTPFKGAANDGRYSREGREQQTAATSDSQRSENMKLWRVLDQFLSLRRIFSKIINNSSSSGNNSSGNISISHNNNKASSARSYYVKLLEDDQVHESIRRLMHSGIPYVTVLSQLVSLTKAYLSSSILNIIQEDRDLFFNSPSFSLLSSSAASLTSETKEQDSSHKSSSSSSSSNCSRSSPRETGKTTRRDFDSIRQTLLDSADINIEMLNILLNPMMCNFFELFLQQYGCSTDITCLRCWRDVRQILDFDVDVFVYDEIGSGQQKSSILSGNLHSKADGAASSGGGGGGSSTSKPKYAVNLNFAIFDEFQYFSSSVNAKILKHLADSIKLIYRNFLAEKSVIGNEKNKNNINSSRPPNHLLNNQSSSSSNINITNNGNSYLQQQQQQQQYPGRSKRSSVSKGTRLKLQQYISSMRTTRQLSLFDILRSQLYPIIVSINSLKFNDIENLDNKFMISLNIQILKMLKLIEREMYLHLQQTICPSFINFSEEFLHMLAYVTHQKKKTKLRKNSKQSGHSIANQSHQMNHLGWCDEYRHMSESVIDYIITLGSSLQLSKSLNIEEEDGGEEKERDGRLHEKELTYVIVDDDAPTIIPSNISSNGNSISNSFAISSNSKSYVNNLSYVEILNWTSPASFSRLWLRKISKSFVCGPYLAESLPLSLSNRHLFASFGGSNSSSSKGGRSYNLDINDVDGIYKFSSKRERLQNLYSLSAVAVRTVAISEAKGRFSNQTHLFELSANSTSACNSSDENCSSNRNSKSDFTSAQKGDGSNDGRSNSRNFYSVCIKDSTHIRMLLYSIICALSNKSLLIKLSDFNEEMHTSIHNAIRRCAYPFIVEACCKQYILRSDDDFRAFRDCKDRSIAKADGRHSRFAMDDFHSATSPSDTSSSSSSSPPRYFNDIITIKASVYRQNMQYFNEKGFIVLDWTSSQLCSSAASTLSSSSGLNYENFMTLNSASFCRLSRDIQAQLQTNCFHNNHAGEVNGNLNKKRGHGHLMADNYSSSSSDSSLNLIEIAFQKYWNSILLKFLPENIDVILDLDILSCNIKRLLYDILADRGVVSPVYCGEVDYSRTNFNDVEISFIFGLIVKAKPSFENVLIRHFNHTKDWRY